MTGSPANSFAPNTEGTFDIPDSLYHDHIKAPDISRGLIVEMLQETPAHVKALLDGQAKPFTKAMQFGTLLDKALLEPDRFKAGMSHWIVPEGIKLSTKEGIAWKKDHPGIKDEGGLPYLKATNDSPSEASAEDMQEMIESIMRHKVARRIIEQSIKQESAFAVDKDTGLMRKARPDMRLVDNHSRLVLVDLKSTFRGGAGRRAWKQHARRMGYLYQDSHYSGVYEDLFGETPFFNFLVVERKPPYAVQLFQIGDRGKHFAIEECKRAMAEFRKCKETGIWPAYPEIIQTIDFEDWELQPKEEMVVNDL